MPFGNLNGLCVIYLKKVHYFFLSPTLFSSISPGPYFISFSDKNFDYHGKCDLMLMPSSRFAWRGKA